MDVTAAVDQLVQYQENVAPTDGGYGNRTVRTLLRLQQAYDTIELFREWHWRITTNTDVIPVETSAIALPDDFASLGRSGGLFVRNSVQDPWERLGQESPERVADEIDAQTSLVDVPDTYAIYSGSFNFLAMGVEKLYKLRYLKVPKQLSYVPSPGTPDTFEIPVAYHHTVVMAGAIVRLQRAKGDGREDWLAQYRAGLSDMVSRERDPEAGVQQMFEAVPPMC